MLWGVAYLPRQFHRERFISMCEQLRYHTSHDRRDCSEGEGGQ